MPFGQEAVYIVEHTMGWKVQYFRMRTRIFERAQAGYLLPQGWICDGIHEQIKQELGRDPGLIRYEDLTFVRRRVIPRRASRPPKMKAAPAHKSYRTNESTSRR